MLFWKFTERSKSFGWKNKYPKRWFCGEAKINSFRLTLFGIRNSKKKRSTKFHSGSESLSELLQVGLAGVHVVGGSVVREPHRLAYKVALRFNEILQQEMIHICQLLMNIEQDLRWHPRWSDDKFRQGWRSSPQRQLQFESSGPERFKTKSQS